MVFGTWQHDASPFRVLHAGRSADVQDRQQVATSRSIAATARRGTATIKHTLTAAKSIMLANDQLCDGVYLRCGPDMSGDQIGRGGRR